MEANAPKGRKQRGQTAGSQNGSGGLKRLFAKQPVGEHSEDPAAKAQRVAEQTDGAEIAETAPAAQSASAQSSGSLSCPTRAPAPVAPTQAPLLSADGLLIE